MYSLTLATLFFSCFSVYHPVEAIGKCGFPGKPENGNIIPELALYSENQIVTYSCPRPYSLFVDGSSDGTRKCTENGTWTGAPPICSPLITLKKKSQTFPSTSSSALLNSLVDDTTLTCLELKPTTFRRWISIDLGERFGVRLVKLFSKEGTMLNVSVSVKDSLTNKTTQCGSYEGKYPGTSVRIDCLTLYDRLGFPGGIPGDKLIVEELSVTKLPLVVCDIDAYAYTANAKCGQPEAPAFGSADYTEATKVEFKCQKGFTLIGPKDRYCDPKGSWSHWPVGKIPICRLENWQTSFSTGKNCPALEKWIPNAAIFYQLDRSVAVVECKEGYELAANKILLCTGFGVWLGYAGPGAHCKKKLNCGEPPIFENYALQHVEGFSGPSQALYFCKSSSEVFGVSKCRDNGTWTGLQSNSLCESLTTSTTPITTTTRFILPLDTIDSTFEANVTEIADSEKSCSEYTNWVFLFVAAWAVFCTIVVLILCCYRPKRYERQDAMQFSHLRTKFGNEGNSVKAKSRESKRTLQDLPLCDLDDSQPVSNSYEIAH